MSETVQVRNPQMVNILSSDFQLRYESSFAWRVAISAFLAVPGVRAFYPMSAVGVAGEAQDLQSLGNHLTRNGDPQFNFDALVPYCQYDGTGDYHDITDAGSGNAFDILGTETVIEAAVRGLTLGCWVRPEETSTLEGIIAKWGGAGSRAYRLYLDASDQFNFEVSDDGTNSDVATSAAVAMDAWYFVAGRFTPSSFVDVFVNGVEVNQATARASAFNTGSNFTIGALSGGASELQGRVSMGFITPMALSDAIINSLFWQTCAMCGVHP